MRDGMAGGGWSDGFYRLGARVGGGCQGARMGGEGVGSSVEIIQGMICKLNCNEINKCALCNVHFMFFYQSDYTT